MGTTTRCSGALSTTLRVGLAAMLLCRAGAVLAATVAVQDAAGDAGSPVEICVNMTGSGGTVAGVQLEMNWDTNCLNVTKGSGDSAACFANPQTGKDVHTKVSSNSLKALFLSVSDVAPIPDVWLFCCAFDIPSSVTATRCGINLTNVIGSDSKGQEIPMSPRGGSLTINETSRAGQAPAARGGVGQPPAVSLPGGVPAVPGGQAPAPGAARGPLPAGAGAKAPAVQPEALGGQPAERLEEATPGEPTQPASAPTGTRQPQQTGTPQRTAAAATTPTPRPQETATALTTTTPQESPTAAEPTPKQKGKGRKKHAP